MLENYPTFSNAMWPIFDDSLSDQQSPQGTVRRPQALKELVERIGNFADFRYHDTSLKFWLPEPAEQALAEVAKRNALTMSEFLRQFFAVHCYGLYAFYAMKDVQPRLFKDAEQGVFYQEAVEALPPRKKRIKTYWVPELGKNIAPVKVWLPSRMRADLAALAQHAGLTLSNYAREIVISRLLGQGMLPTRPQMFDVAPTLAAEDWGEDREVPWRQVPEADRSKFAVTAERSDVVDE